MHFKKLMIFFIGMLILSCVDTNDQKPNSNSKAKKVNKKLGSTLFSSVTITDENFWKYNNKLNELMNEDGWEERYELAMKIDSSNISKENRDSFNLTFFLILMESKDYNRAIIILRDRYVNNPLHELSMNENLYFYYYWGTFIKLGATDCDSADFYFKKLKELSDEVVVFSNHKSDGDLENLEKILYESCLHLN